MKIGEYVTLKTFRKTDLGFMLTDGVEEVLLHYAQSKCEHEVGDLVTVFIYADKKKRPTATEMDVTITLGHPGFAHVVDVSENGVFVNINTPKDIKISKDDLGHHDYWPQVGDTLFVNLKLKNDSLIGELPRREFIKNLKKNVMYQDYEMVDGYVIKVGEKGLSIISKDMMYIFVPTFETRGKYRIGEEVKVKITKNIGNEYYGSLIENKEVMIDEDRNIILDYLNHHHYQMKLTAKSSSEDVFKILKMSRKAFKRAYGGLYKDNLIEFDEEKTWLKK